MQRIGILLLLTMAPTCAVGQDLYHSIRVGEQYFHHTSEYLWAFDESALPDEIRRDPPLARIRDALVRLPFDGAYTVDAAYYSPMEDRRGRLLGTRLLVTRGTRVITPFPCRVYKVGFDVDGFGNYVVLSYFNYEEQVNFRLIIGHLDVVAVVEGEQLDAGRDVGASGNTGLSVEPSIFLSVLYQDKYIDPSLVFDIED